MKGPELFKPPFRFLDGLVRDYGDILYMGLVYASPLLIAWVLSGGLRRMQSRHGVAATIRKAAIKARMTASCR